MALDQTGEIPLARYLPSRRLAKGLLAARGVARQGLKEAQGKIAGFLAANKTLSIRRIGHL